MPIEITGILGKKEPEGDILAAMLRSAQHDSWCHWFMDPCWYQQGGYAQVWDKAAQKTTQAHRFVYQQLVGPIPAGMQLDHLCRVRTCVNPDHLRIVQPRENVHAQGSRSIAVVHAAKTHCSRGGHPYNEQNTYTRKGMRYCRVCNKEKQQARRNSARGAIPTRDAGCTPEPK